MIIDRHRRRKEQKMMMTVKEAIDRYEGEYTAIEFYRPAFNSTSGFHTDAVEEIDSPVAPKAELDRIYSGIEALDFQLMDREDYDTTVLANTCLSFTDMYEPTDKILCILVPAMVEAPLA